MAVDRSQKSIRDFSLHYRKVLIWIVLGSQLAVIVAVGLIIFISGAASWQDPAVWTALAVSLGVGVVILMAFLPMITEPLYSILAALSHKTGELTTSTPPNPNSKSYQSTGFKAVLQAIYGDDGTSDAEGKTKIDQAGSILTDALNHTSSGVVILGPDKKIISANTAAPIGYTQEGEPFLALNFIEDEDIMAWLSRAEDKTINSENRWHRVSTDPRVMKRQRFFDIVASYEKGAAAETVIILIDQTNHYGPEEEDLNFIAFAAHELRGPITIIRGYLDVLNQELSDRLKGDEPELISRLIVSSSKLSSYVNNILNVAKFDRHHLRVHLTEDTASAIYASIADDMQMRAQTQHRLLNINIPDSLPTVAADRGSVSEVLSNLIDNAIKYSFEGGLITVSAEAKGDFVEFSVQDNGVGIPANVVKNLFRKFYRSHRSREAVSGTGIGLYIAKAFVESHGGSISVTSKENEGSTFSFTLPIYATVADKLLEDGQLNQSLVRRGGGWIRNHSMYRK